MSNSTCCISSLENSFSLLQLIKVNVNRNSINIPNRFFVFMLLFWGPVFMCFLVTLILISSHLNYLFYFGIPNVFIHIVSVYILYSDIQEYVRINCYLSTFYLPCYRSTVSLSDNSNHTDNENKI